MLVHLLFCIVWFYPKVEGNSNSFENGFEIKEKEK
jgi:hypothetical protein